ncbi:hypothetical protein K438DRAFT_2097397, partial [Mycena galopus ATCC 62051]
LTHGACNARSDDTKNLKAAIVLWLQRLFINMPALDVESREDRGIYNDFAGALLCPTEYDWNDLEVRAMIREGDPDHLVTAGSWFNGLYPHDKFDPENPDIGLFRNVVLMNVSWDAWECDDTDSFISNLPRRPHKPKGPAQTPKRSVATLIGLKCVTGRSIAYAAVQVCTPSHKSALFNSLPQYRVALSDSRQWDQHDGSFDYSEFYNNVIDYFKSPPGPVAKLEVDRLLDFWNMYVKRTPLYYIFLTLAIATHLDTSPPGHFTKPVPQPILL